MRRSTVLQRVEQEAELLLLLVGIDAEQTEHGLLHFVVVDTHRATAHFVTVDHHVVGVGHGRRRVGFQRLGTDVLGGGKGMVHGIQAVVFFLEHREVDDPQRLPALFDQIQVLAQLQTQGAHGIAHHLGGVGTEEDGIAVLCTGAGQQLGHDGFVQELGHRRLYSFQALGDVVHLQPGQALGTVDADELAVFIDLLARQGGTTGYSKRGHAALGIVGRAGEHLKVDVLHQIGNVDQLHRNTQIRLVGAVTTHGFGIAHHREGAQIHARHVLPQILYQLFHHFPHLFGAHEGGFHIDLGKFGLTVGTQIFVAEAFDDLVVTVEAAHHQQLLEQLR